MPLTERGFERLTYEEILESQIIQAQLLFGEDIDTSEQSTFGKILRLYCLNASENQELGENVYLSGFPHTARGVSLDRLCPLAGISRNPATYAQHVITISGTVGTVVSMGFLVSTNIASGNEVTFHTIEDYTIGASGTVDATVECNNAGVVGNVSVGSISVIVNPIAGVSGIEHISISSLASDIETDYELRTRFTQALTGAGSGTIDAIRGNIMRISGVESVLIEENDTNNTVDGIAPHGFRCYVLAPNTNTMKQNIAEAIFEKKPVGIDTTGSVSAQVLDEGNGTHTINFSWTEEVYIHVRCNINTNSNYSDSSLQEIKDNIVAKLSTYTNGQDVTATSLYGAVFATGVDDITSLTISSDGVTYSTSTITVNKNQVARIVSGNIEVTVNV